MTRVLIGVDMWAVETDGERFFERDEDGYAV